MKKSKNLLFIILMLSCLQATCQDHQPEEIDNDLQSCLDGTDMVTAAMCSCYTQATKRWDLKLDTLYQKLIKSLNPTIKQSLIQSQQQWLKYKEVEFQLIEVASGSGTMWNWVVLGKKMSVIRQRVYTLNGILENLDDY